MRSSSIEVVLLMFSSNFKFQYFPGWVGVGWVESRIRPISAETEAEALLGLAELGNICFPHDACLMKVVQIWLIMMLCVFYMILCIFNESYPAAGLMIFCVFHPMICLFI